MKGSMTFWMPHHPETWPFKFMTAKMEVMMDKSDRVRGANVKVKNRLLPIGTRVKIVMASRFGDLGITDDLDATFGYGARIPIDCLSEWFGDFSNEK